MSESIFLNTWLEKRANLKNTGLILSGTRENENLSQVNTTLKDVFWITIAVLNALILSDLFLNNSGTLIDLLILATGGYRG